MAKQSGLHGIRGKVGEYTYYEQTGVAGGLVRRINQGLSERVKNDAAYANTRLNNQEFTQAAGIAALYGRMVHPKFRPMVLPFSQSRMVKSIIELIKADTSGAAWGRRNVTSDTISLVSDALNATAKNNFNDLVPEISFNFGDLSTTGVRSVDVKIEVTEDAFNTLIGKGADGMYIKSTWFAVGVGGVNPYDIKKYQLSQLEQLETDQVVISGSYDNEIEDHVSKVGFQQGAIKDYVFVAIAMPFKTVANTKHVLQEMCTFKAYSIGVTNIEG